MEELYKLTCGMVYAGETGTFVHMLGCDCPDKSDAWIEAQRVENMEEGIDFVKNPNLAHVVIPDPEPERKPHKCPVCIGTGLVSRPPGVAGDVDSWTDNQTAPYPCRACGGAGIIWG